MPSNNLYISDTEVRTTSILFDVNVNYMTSGDINGFSLKIFYGYNTSGTVVASRGYMQCTTYYSTAMSGLEPDTPYCLVAYAYANGVALGSEYCTAQYFKTEKAVEPPPPPPVTTPTITVNRSSVTATQNSITFDMSKTGDIDSVLITCYKGNDIVHQNPVTFATQLNYSITGLSPSTEYRTQVYALKSGSLVASDVFTKITASPILSISKTTVGETTIDVEVINSSPNYNYLNYVSAEIYEGTATTPLKTSYKVSFVGYNTFSFKDLKPNTAYNVKILAYTYNTRIPEHDITVPTITTKQVFIPVQSITMVNPSVYVPINELNQIVYNFVPENATNKEVTVVSSAPTIVSIIQSNGLYYYKGLKTGQATITVTSVQNPKAMTTKSVGVAGSGTVSIRSTSSSYDYASIMTFALDASNDVTSIIAECYLRGTTTKVGNIETIQPFLNTTNQYGARVDVKGLLPSTAYTFKVYPYCGGILSSNTLAYDFTTTSARWVALTGIDITNLPMSLNNGQELQLAYTMTPSDAHCKDVTVTSSDTSVAQIIGVPPFNASTNPVKIRCNGAGRTTITVKGVDQNYVTNSEMLTVNPIGSFSYDGYGGDGLEGKFVRIGYTLTGEIDTIECICRSLTGVEVFRGSEKKGDSNKIGVTVTNLKPNTYYNIEAIGTYKGIEVKRVNTQVLTENPIPITQIVLSNADFVRVGEVCELVTTLYPYNTSFTGINYTIDDGTVIERFYENNKQYIRGLKMGSTIIKAYANAFPDIKASIFVTVGPIGEVTITKTAITESSIAVTYKVTGDIDEIESQCYSKVDKDFWDIKNYTIAKNGSMTITHSNLNPKETYNIHTVVRNKSNSGGYIGHLDNDYTTSKGVPLPKNVYIFPDGKNIYVSFQNESDIKETILEPNWTQTLLTTTTNIFEFTVPEFNKEYSFKLLNKDINNVMSKYTETFTFKSGIETINPPTNVAITVNEQRVTVTFTKEPLAEFTQLIKCWDDLDGCYETDGETLEFDVEQNITQDLLETIKIKLRSVVYKKEGE